MLRNIILDSDTNHETANVLCPLTTINLTFSVIIVLY
jgi:hypothetical protein